MEALPELLSEAVDDGTVIETVDIGGGDAVAVTRGETHVYRSDGLLSDESVERFEHDVERLSMRTKRRKSEIRLETLDSEQSFTVPSKSADAIVEAMVEGILRTDGIVDADEEVLAQFRFSELTLLVTDGRLFEHVGSAVWDDDFETVGYGELTGLAFEKGSVATQVVLETDERRRRVKVPNEHAGRVRREIQEAVFDFYGVSSLEELRAELSAEPDEPETDPDATVESASDGETRSASENTPAGTNEADQNATGDSFVSADWTPSEEQPVAESEPQPSDARADGTAAADIDGRGDDGSGQSSTDPEIEALTERMDALSAKVDRQTELIESQRELIDQLVDELRRGR